MFKIPRNKLLPLLAAGMLLIAGLGAAAIPGAVTGDAPAVVQQAITVTEVKTALWTSAITPQSGVTLTKQSTSLSAGTTSSDKTSFLAPVTVSTGDSYQIQLTLKNSSKVDASAIMTIDAPAGFTVVQMEKDGTKVKGAAQFGTRGWLVTLKDNTETTLGDLSIDIRTDDTISPGFYLIGVTLKQVEG